MNKVYKGGLSKLINKNKMKKDIEEVIRFYMDTKDWEVSDKEFPLVARSFKSDADKLLRLGKDVEKVKRKTKLTKKWCESRDLEWSLGTVVKKWFDKMKPKKEKKHPYYRGQRMYEKGDTWFVIPNDGGKHLEFSGSKEDIEWKTKKEVKNN